VLFRSRRAEAALHAEALLEAEKRLLGAVGERVSRTGADAGQAQGAVRDPEIEAAEGGAGRERNPVDGCRCGTVHAAEGMAQHLALVPQEQQTGRHRGLPPRHALELLDAFRMDARKNRYADWDELMDYCDRSAASVGRVMMDIHGETATADIEGSDALCNALQMLNHVQDCKKDYLALDRVYLPEPWLKEAGGGVEDLANSHASPAVRAVIDRCLDQVDTLLARARAMPATVKRRRFRVECALIVQLALALSKKLRRQDPVAQRVKVSKLGWLWCGARAIIRAW